MKAQSIQIEYLEKLLEVVDLLEKSDNSIERQRSLYYLRQLGSIKLRTGDSGDGPTSLETFEVTRKQRDLFSHLSNLGTESLFDSER